MIDLTATYTVLVGKNYKKAYAIMNLIEAINMVAKDERELQEKYSKVIEQETDPFVKAFLQRIVKDAIKHEKKVYKKYEKVLAALNKKTY